MNLKNILQYVPILSRLAAKLNESYNRGIYSVMSGNHSMLTSSAFALCGIPPILPIGNQTREDTMPGILSYLYTHLDMTR